MLIMCLRVSYHPCAKSSPSIDCPLQQYINTLQCWTNDLLPLCLCLSTQSTCSWVWWWCIFCYVPSTKWPTCTAWPPSSSCRAARSPTWKKTGSPLCRTNMKTRCLLTWQRTRPASPWSRGCSPRTTPWTQTELCGGREKQKKVYLWQQLSWTREITHPDRWAESEFSSFFFILCLFSFLLSKTSQEFCGCKGISWLNSANPPRPKAPLT